MNIKTLRYFNKSIGSLNFKFVLLNIEPHKKLENTHLRVNKLNHKMIPTERIIMEYPSAKPDSLSYQNTISNR